VKYKQPRDSQRSRIYRAEVKAFYGSRAKGMRFDSLDGLQRFLERAVADPWFKTHFGALSRIEIRDGRGTRHASSAYEPDTRRCVFSFPRWARTKPVVLHELAHAASFRRYGLVAAHGPEFAAVFLELVERHLGRAARERLRRAFVLQNVGYEVAARLRRAA
jgi:putative metallohydrolase (TIGR04338 family)